MVTFFVSPSEECRVFAFADGIAFEVFEKGPVDAERLHVVRFVGWGTHMSLYYHDTFFSDGCGNLELGALTKSCDLSSTGSGYQVEDGESYTISPDFNDKCPQKFNN